MIVKDLSMAAWPFWLKRLTVFLTTYPPQRFPFFYWPQCGLPHSMHSVHSHALHAHTRAVWACCQKVSLSFELMIV